MEQKIKFLKSIMDSEQFVLTGSQCMKLMGLLPDSNANDIDVILVNPTKETKEMLERLQTAHSATTKFSTPDKGVIFMYEGVKVDVFYRTEKIPSKIKAWGEIDLSLVHLIVEAKKSYNRMKDWTQLRKISRMFFKSEEFEKFLNDSEKLEQLSENNYLPSTPKK